MFIRTKADIGYIEDQEGSLLPAVYAQLGIIYVNKDNRFYSLEDPDANFMREEAWDLIDEYIWEDVTAGDIYLFYKIQGVCLSELLTKWENAFSKQESGEKDYKLSEEDIGTIRDILQGKAAGDPTPEYVREWGMDLTCPLCGESAKLDQWDPFERGEGWRVVCTSYDERSHDGCPIVGVWYDTQEEAIDSWRNRVMKTGKQK